jgi:hypothetical protein
MQSLKKLLLKVSAHFPFAFSPISTRRSLIVLQRDSLPEEALARWARPGKWWYPEVLTYSLRPKFWYP